MAYVVQVDAWTEMALAPAVMGPAPAAHIRPLRVQVLTHAVPGVYEPGVFPDVDSAVQLRAVYREPIGLPPPLPRPRSVHKHLLFNYVKVRGSMRVCTGANFNLLRFGVLTAVSTFDEDYPVGKLSDQRSGEMAKLDVVDDFIVDADLDILLGAGGMESLVNWADADTGDGASTQDGAAARPGSTGSNSLKLEAGTGTAVRVHDVTIPSDKPFRLELWEKTSGGGNVVVSIQNRHTGKFLQGDGTWAVSGDLYTLTGTGWAEQALEFFVESYEATEKDEVTLRIILSSSSGTGWVDDLILIPGVDCTSIHGHNFPRAAVVKVFSADEPTFAAPEEQALLSGAQPACGEVNSFGPQFHRFWRLSATAAYYLEEWFCGEWVLGCTYLLEQQPLHQGLETWKRGGSVPQVSSQTELGEMIRINLAEAAQENREFPFMDFTVQTLKRDLMDQLFERTRFGALAFVIFPDDNDTEALLVKGAGGGWTADSLREGQDGWTRSFSVQELPFPVNAS